MWNLLIDKRYRVFLLTIALLVFLNGTIRTAIPILSREAGFSITEIGWAQGLFSIGWPVFGIIAGVLIDKSHKTKLAFIAIACFLVLHFTAIAAVGFNSGNNTIFIYALFAGIMIVSIEAFVLAVPPLKIDGKKLASFYSLLFFMEFTCSYFLAPTINTALISISSMLFYALIIIALLGVLATIKKGLSDLPEIKKETIDFAYVSAGFKTIFNNRYLTSLTILTFFLSVVFGAFLTCFIVLVTDPAYMNLEKQAYGLMLSAYALGAMLSVAFLRNLFGATGIRIAVITDVLGTAALLIVPTFYPNASVVWLTTFLAGIALGLWFVTITTFRQKLTPSDRLGRTNAAFRVIGYTGLPAGSFLIGYLTEITSLQSAVLIVVGMLMGAFILILPVVWPLDEADEIKKEQIVAGE